MSFSRRHRRTVWLGQGNPLRRGEVRLRPLGGKNLVHKCPGTLPNSLGPKVERLHLAWDQRPVMAPATPGSRCHQRQAQDNSSGTGGTLARRTCAAARSARTPVPCATAPGRRRAATVTIKTVHDTKRLHDGSKQCGTKAREVILLEPLAIPRSHEAVDGVTFRNVPDESTHVGGQPLAVMPHDLGGASGRSQKAEEHANRGALARAVAAEQREHRARGNLQGELLHRHPSPEDACESLCLNREVHRFTCPLLDCQGRDFLGGRATGQVTPGVPCRPRGSGRSPEEATGPTPTPRTGGQVGAKAAGACAQGQFAVMPGGV
jgi:hypothetical protein